MSWQQPQGGGSGYNANAQAWTPGQGQGGYNQQQGGYQQGGYQQGGYQQGGYGGYQQQGYGGYNQGYQQGGYNQGYQQGGYNQGYNNQQGGYNNRGGYQQQQQGAPAPAGLAPVGEQSAPAPAPAPAAPAQPPAPKVSQADKNKLTLDLGGSKKKKSNFVMPKKGESAPASLQLGGGGGGSLTIGGKKDDEPKKSSTTLSIGGGGSSTLTIGGKKEEEKPEEAPVAEEKPAEEEKATPAPESPAESSATASPTTASPTTAEAPKEKKTKASRPKKEYKRDPRPHFNVVFCGHVDAGKSTISGHLLADNGVVEERELEKLKAEAVKLNREGWGYAYVMDCSEEERAKGKTHETGAAYFETKERRITVLDAPGHKAFVPSMIGGAAQADVCVLVISARTGEFETGFENGGQTREHAMLVRACGVKHLICVVNKMDECDWSQERYTEIQTKMKTFLRQNGFDEKQKNIAWMPVTGLGGANLNQRLDSSINCPWYGGMCLMEYLNQLVLPATKSEDDELVLPLAGAYKDDGKTFVYGKVESGSIVVGDRLSILPIKGEVIVEGLQIEQTPIEKAYPGDNVHVRVKGVDENEIHPGYVAAAEDTTLKAVDYFQAKIVVLEVKNLLSNGSRMMMNMGVGEMEVSIHKILGRLDPKTHEPVEKEPSHIKGREAFLARLELSQSAVVEDHKKFDKLGRFMLREEGRTIAIGVVTKLYETTREQLASGTAQKK